MIYLPGRQRKTQLKGYCFLISTVVCPSLIKAKDLIRLDMCMLAPKEEAED